MNNTEKQMNAIVRCLTADSSEEREQAREELRRMVSDKEALSAVGVEETIEDLLLELGVPCHLNGHPYLVTAVMAAAKEPGTIGAITGELYPQVAKAFDTTPSRVERAIRHAIEVAWDRGNLDTQQQIFGYTIDPNKGKPTNSEFIARVAKIVRRTNSAAYGGIYNAETDYSTRRRRRRHGERCEGRTPSAGSGPAGAAPPGGPAPGAAQDCPGPDGL